MREVWLRNNTRALTLGMVPPAVVGGLGASLAAQWWGDLGLGGQVLGWVLLAPAAAMIGVLAWQRRQPRLAYEDGRLLVFLGMAPWGVPVEVVECFLVGQDAAHLPGRGGEEAETATIVVRLSPRADEWAQREVRPALGRWCDHHITIRGTWCEPITPELLRRLNANLTRATREVQAQEAK